MKKSGREELPHPAGEAERVHRQIYVRGYLWCFLSTFLNGGIEENPALQRAPDTHTHAHWKVDRDTYTQSVCAIVNIP